MEVLNIIFAVLSVCVIALVFACLVALIIRNTKLSKVKNYNDLNKALSYGTKLLNVTIVIALLCISSGMLCLAFTVHPPKSDMQIAGIVFAVFWFLIAALYIFLIKKKK